MTDEFPSLFELLGKLEVLGGSDLHLKVGSAPAYRIDGVLHPAELDPLTPEDTLALLGELVPERLRDRASDFDDLDFAYGQPGLGRFRVNTYRQRGSVNIVVRSVLVRSKTLSELGLPLAIAKACDEQSGLIVVTGPAGAGKTTTCAAMVEHINSSSRKAIVTIEDPIEVLHRDKQSIVSQREVGVDTPSFAAGMSAALRQDPDVIYVGELRDPETIETALVGAETGHLVISTMYTLNALETLHRILDSFPPYLERRTRQMLATSLRMVVSQRLVPKSDGQGRVVATELLINTEEVQERIVDSLRTNQIHDVIDEGAFYGMHTLDHSIVELFKAGRISFADGLAYVASQREFKALSGTG